MWVYQHIIGPHFLNLFFFSPSTLGCDTVELEGNFMSMDPVKRKCRGDGCPSALVCVLHRLPRRL